MVRQKKMSPIAVICINLVLLVILYFLISLFFSGRADWWNAIAWDKPMSGGDLVAFCLAAGAFMCAVYIIYGFVQLIRFGPKGAPATNQTPVPDSAAHAVPQRYKRQGRRGASAMIFMILVVVAAIFVLPTMTKTGAFDTQLQSEHADVRISAVDKLAEYGSGGLTRPFIGKRAVELLSNALQDEDSGVRIAAAEGLGRIGNEDAIDNLAVALRDENADVVFAALHALERIGTDEAVMAIANALDGDVALRQMSLCVLAETDNNSAQQVLRSEPDASIDPAKMKTLAVAALSNAFRESDTEGQLRIISALKNIGTSDATDAIASFLKLDREEISRASVNALIVIGGDGAVTALAEALQSSNAALRVKAADALKEIGNPSALDALTSALQSKKEDSQKNAALALTSVDNEVAEEALNALIEQHNLPVIAYIYDYFIREGIIESEPVMIEALNRYGSTVMAEAFLNCGNSALEEAATEWADRHGYDIIQSSWGGIYPKWGSH